ncbi:MAG: hypothetical protein AAB863_04230 [Patescibacteria group bacterium]
MSAKTAAEVKARLLDLTTGVLELVRDGNRDAESVCEVFQTIKDDPLFASRFFSDIPSRLRDWQSFYKKFFGLDTDFSSIRIPERKSGFDRLLIIAQGFTPNRVYDACSPQNFACWRYVDDLDVSVTHNDRVPTEHYAIWVRDRQEADEELKNISANDLQKKKINGITLLERMVFGLKYWSETGRHLDVKNVTLCAGSRHRDGYVPRVCWVGSYGRVHVSWFHPDDSDSRLRSRQAVS